MCERSRGLIIFFSTEDLLATPPRGPMNRLSSEQTEKETEDYESTQDVSVNKLVQDLLKSNLTFLDQGPRFKLR